MIDGASPTRGAGIDRVGPNPLDFEVAFEAREEGRSRSVSEPYSPLVSSANAVRRGTGVPVYVGLSALLEFESVAGFDAEPLVKSATVRGSSSGIVSGSVVGAVRGVAWVADDLLEYRCDGLSTLV
jgi:hypothetical protein